MKMGYRKVEKMRKKLSKLARNTMAFYVRLKRQGKKIKAIGNTMETKIVKKKNGLKRLKLALRVLTRLFQAQAEIQNVELNEVNPFSMERKIIDKLGTWIKLGIHEIVIIKQYIASLTMYPDCPEERRQFLYDLVDDDLPDPVSYGQSKHLSINMSYRDFIGVRKIILGIPGTRERLHRIANFDVGSPIGTRPMLTAKFKLKYLTLDENCLPVEVNGGGCRVIIPTEDLVKIKEPYVCDQRFGKCLPHFAVESLRAYLLYRRNVLKEKLGPETLCFPALNGWIYKMGKTGSRSQDFYSKMRDEFKKALVDQPTDMTGVYLTEYDERHTSSHIIQCLSLSSLKPWLKANHINVTNLNKLLSMVAKEQLGQKQSTNDVNETYYTNKVIWSKILYYVVNTAWSFMDDIEHLDSWLDKFRWGLDPVGASTQNVAVSISKEQSPQDSEKEEGMEELKMELKTLEKQYRKGNITELTYKLEKSLLEKEIDGKNGK